MSTSMHISDLDNLAARVSDAYSAAASSCVSSSVEVATRVISGFSRMLICAI